LGGGKRKKGGKGGEKMGGGEPGKNKWGEKKPTMSRKRSSNEFDGILGEVVGVGGDGGGERVWFGGGGEFVTEATRLKKGPWGPGPSVPM